MSKQHPRIVFSPLGKSWYVVTRYREKRGVNMDGEDIAYLVAATKYDVTDQMEAILKAHSRKTKPRRQQQEAKP